MDMALDDVITTRPGYRSHSRRASHQRSTARVDLDAPLEDAPPRRHHSNNPYNRISNFKNTRNVPEGRWQNDMYDNDGETQRSAQRDTSRNSMAPTGPSTKVLVENLHWNVTEPELNELFSTIGQIKSAKIQFDNAGRSEGKGHVEFFKVEDATASVEQFHGRDLDELTLSVTYTATPIKARLGVRVTDRLGAPPGGDIKNRLGKPAQGTSNYRGNVRGSYHSNGRGRAAHRGTHGGHNRNDNSRTPASALDLDAEMDAYMETTVPRKIVNYSEIEFDQPAL